MTLSLSPLSLLMRISSRRYERKTISFGICGVRAGILSIRVYSGKDAKGDVLELLR